MTIGSRKNLAIFAKQIAFMSSMAGFGADLKNGDFRKLKFNSPINTKLSEMAKEKNRSSNVSFLQRYEQV